LTKINSRALGRSVDFAIFSLLQLKARNFPLRALSFSENVGKLTCFLWEASFASYAGEGMEGRRNSSGGGGEVVDRVKGDRHGPPPSASWAENTITECTHESGLLQSTVLSGPWVLVSITKRVALEN
jgi:hypothetical protein